MKNVQISICFIVITLFGLTACSEAETSSPAGSEPAVAAETSGEVTEPAPAAETSSDLTTPPQAAADETEDALPTLSPTPSPEPTATSTPLPTATPTLAPTMTATPTLVPDPVVRVEDSDININVRSGPGTAYPVVTQFEPGQEAVVIGRNADDSWWQVALVEEAEPETAGWLFAELVAFEGEAGEIAVVEAPPPPTPDPAAVAQAEAEAAAGEAPAETDNESPAEDTPQTPQELAEALRCGKDFCVTYQAMVPIWENGGCVGNHSIYITVLEGPPPGQPMDGVVIGDTFDNVEVASGSHGPGQTEITLWMNSMTLKAKRHIDGTPYTSEESFNFTAHDELIPAEVLAANGYCDGSVEKCRHDQQHNSICRGHYSWRVTFHKFD